MPPSPEIITGGARGGVWNFHALNVDTNTSPVSGRFRTNTGAYRGANQIAIHGITVQGTNRVDTMQSMLVDDIIQFQDVLVSDAWCRYVLQSPPVNKGGWFQLNVAIEADGNVKSGDNQEVIVLFTANSNAVAVPVYAETTAYVRTTAAMAGALDTRPQRTDGAQLLTASITPRRVANKLRIQATIPFGSVGDGGVWFALFRDNTAAAFHAVISDAAKNDASIAKLDVEIPAAATLPTTIELRFGNLAGNSQAVGINGNSVGRWMGGASRATLSITEHT
jgi:hypothetical protein